MDVVLIELLQNNLMQAGRCGKDKMFEATDFEDLALEETDNGVALWLWQREEARLKASQEGNSTEFLRKGIHFTEKVGKDSGRDVLKNWVFLHTLGLPIKCSKASTKKFGPGEQLKLAATVKIWADKIRKLHPQRSLPTVEAPSKETFDNLKWFQSAKKDKRQFMMQEENQRPVLAWHGLSVPIDVCKGDTQLLQKAKNYILVDRCGTCMHASAC